MTEEKQSHFPRLLSLIIAMIPLSFALLALFFVIPNITEQQRPICDQMIYKVTSYTPIYSTEDGTAIRGLFFLGSGRVDTYMVYYFYTGDDVNGFQHKMLDAQNTYIFRDSETPYMLTKIKYRMSPMDELIQVRGCLPIEVNELHVPNDTLIKEM
jgi:hypothetical protein